MANPPTFEQVKYPTVLYKDKSWILELEVNCKCTGTATSIGVNEGTLLIDIR